MNYGLFKSLLGNKLRVPMKAPSTSFRCAPKRDMPFIQPTFKKEIFDSERPSVVLVSAVGATGKTTLAQTLSNETGLPLLDLADHKPVGDNTLKGLLTTAFDVGQLTTVFQGIASGTFGLIIDGLDEGRSKTTEKAFQAFLDGVAELIPTAAGTTMILLGRTVTLEETYLYLSDKNVSVGLVSIEPFGLDSARKYIDSYSKSHESFQQQYCAVRDFILDRLSAAFSPDKGATTADFLSFIGYPPVLDAIVTLLEKEKDFHRLHRELQARVDGNREIQLLDDIAQHISRREKDEKIKPNILTGLLGDKGAEGLRRSVADAFEPVEQCARLVAHTLGKRLSLEEIADPVVNELYEKQLAAFLPEHPFLTGPRFRNVVFESYAVALLIASGEERYQDLAADYFRTHKHSHYLLYLLSLHKNEKVLPASVLPILLGSALEFKSRSLQVEVSVSGPDPDELVPGEKVNLSVDIELNAAMREESARPFEFVVAARNGDKLRLGSRLASSYIRVPCDVAFDEVEETEFTAPVEVVANAITLAGRALVLRSEHKGTAGAVLLEAEKIQSGLESVITNGVEFVVSVSPTETLTFPLIQYAEARARTPGDPLTLPPKLA